nr:MAG TPA: hypothetical protein [Bacteriophage sp.]
MLLMLLEMDLEYFRQLTIEIILKHMDRLLS